MNNNASLGKQNWLSYPQRSHSDIQIFSNIIVIYTDQKWENTIQLATGIIIYDIIVRKISESSDHGNLIQVKMKMP